MEGNLTLTRKQVRLGLKKGWGASKFCEKYGVTESELSERISQLYKYQKKVSGVLSELKVNEKKFNHHKQEVKNRKGVPVSTVTEETKSLGETPEVGDDLEFLIKEEKRLSTEIIGLETWHKEEAEKRRGRLKEMRAIKQEIERLEESLKQACKEFREAVEQADSLAENMNAISRQRYPKVMELQELRAKIEERMSVSLAVYDSGEIVILEGTDFNMDDSGHTEIYARLIESEECQELRLKDIKVMAKLLSIASNSERKISLVCDRPEMEEVYLRLRQNQ